MIRIRLDEETPLENGVEIQFGREPAIYVGYNTEERTYVISREPKKEEATEEAAEKSEWTIMARVPGTAEVGVREVNCPTCLSALIYPHSLGGYECGHCSTEFTIKDK